MNYVVVVCIEFSQLPTKTLIQPRMENSRRDQITTKFRTRSSLPGLPTRSLGPLKKTWASNLNEYWPPITWTHLGNLAGGQFYIKNISLKEFLITVWRVISASSLSKMQFYTLDQNIPFIFNFFLLHLCTEHYGE